MSQLRVMMAATPQATSPPINERPEARVVPWHYLTTILCHEVANSTIDNAPVVYKLLYSALADRLPHRQPFAAVVAFLFNEPGAYQVGVRLLAPDRRLLAHSESEIVIGEPETHSVTAFHFGAVEFSVHGRYRVEVTLNTELVAAYPMLIRRPTESIA